MRKPAFDRHMRKGVSRMKLQWLKLEVRLWFLRLILIFK